MEDIIIKNATIINENDRIVGDLAIKNQRITQYGGIVGLNARKEINGEGLWLIPGIIDDQVHFREPGLTYKATIASESKAALAGGVTSFMEMPNTKPPALTQKLLEDKYSIAAQSAWTNYSFYMGASNDNLEEVLRTNAGNVCGVKIFMGSSTGNMLVDNRLTLENLFSQVHMLIATHCEDEYTIRKNLEFYEKKAKAEGRNLTAADHPIIRSSKGCYISSSLAIELARKHQSRLHILHISTTKECELFDNQTPLDEKKITAEVCVHHLYFCDEDYAKLGNLIKCNPAIKSKKDRNALRKALLENRFDVVATDHAPHTLEEKNQPYLKAPSGLPLVQSSLNIMLNYCEEGWIDPNFMVEKMCHNPAILFRIKNRGYIREGYYADLVLIDPDIVWTLQEDELHYKCKWSPLTGEKFKGKVTHTFINGELQYERGKFFQQNAGHRLEFHQFG